MGSTENWDPDKHPLPMIGPLAYAAVLGQFVRYADGLGLDTHVGTSPETQFRHLDTEIRWLAFRGAIEAFAWRFTLHDADAAWAATFRPIIERLSTQREGEPHAPTILRAFALEASAALKAAP